MSKKNPNAPGVSSIGAWGTWSSRPRVLRVNGEEVSHAQVTVKRFQSGRYEGYMLRVSHHPGSIHIQAEWFPPEATQPSRPPPDIQDALDLWAKNEAFAEMSPVEFVHRMYCDVR